MAEWDRRQLCPDGACVGLIGDDGLCKVCGRAALGDGGAYRSGPSEPVDEDDDDLDDDSDDDSGDEQVERLVDKAETAVHEAEWTERKLCSDGSCTGVIGDDGKCKTCGKAAA